MFAATTLETFGIGLIGASVPVGLGAWFVRRKTKAETADLITQASERLVTMLERRITELETEVHVMRAQVAADQSERAELNRRLAEAEERERTAVRRIAELQGEVDALRLRVARYETPIINKEQAS